MWEDGSQAELHVWPGAIYGFTELTPDAELSVISRKLGASDLFY